MTEPDDVIDILRRAEPEDLPDELVSPHAPAAQALLEEILSMQTIQAPAPPRPRPRRAAGRGLVAAAAALALVAGAAAAVVVLGPSEPSAAAVVERALTATGAERSGRADVTWTIPEIDPTEDVVPAADLDQTWEFSGDDWKVINHDMLADQGFPGDVIGLVVDGEAYGYRPDQLAGGPFEWVYDGPVDLDEEGFGINPATLLDELSPGGDFEDLGEEPVRGIATRHYHATNPEDLPTGPFRSWVQNSGDVVALDVWVDQDDLVRRLDIGFAGGDPDEAGPNETPVSPSTTSIEFYDFGDVGPLEAPPVDVGP